MALTARKGHAASVRRQSRQRLRSERRYRRNRLVRFIVTLYELQVPSRDCTPRALPRASRSGRHVGLRPPRNDKPGAEAFLTPACTSREYRAGPGCPLPYNGRCGRRSATKPAACKALRERRYRRNRCIPFYRHLVRTASASPGAACRSRQRAMKALRQTKTSG